MTMNFDFISYLSSCSFLLLPYDFDFVIIYTFLVIMSYYIMILTFSLINMTVIIWTFYIIKNVLKWAPILSSSKKGKKHQMN